MKKVFLYIPIVLSLLLLGAHFMRYGNTVIVIGVAAMLALLFLRQRWVARFIQFFLVLGALEWLRTLVMLVQMRTAMGEPYLRMAIILGLVTALTVFAAFLFQAKELKAIYHIDAAS
jgi:hypothetical protein